MQAGEKQHGLYRLEPSLHEAPTKTPFPAIHRAARCGTYSSGAALSTVSGEVRRYRARSEVLAAGWKPLSNRRDRANGIACAERLAGPLSPHACSRATFTRSSPTCSPNSSNLACRYCWAFDNHVKGVTEDTAIRASNWLHQTGCRVLALMGGEVLLRPKFVHKVVYYAANKGFWIYIPTNGRLMRVPGHPQAAWMSEHSSLLRDACGVALFPHDVIEVLDGHYRPAEDPDVC